jgi:hydroxylamine dehydrogenase
MPRRRKTGFVLVFFVLILLFPGLTRAAEKISEATASCLECHASIHPGIVEDWKKSRMSRVTPSEAMALKPKERRVSFGEIPKGLGDVVVGCAECHTGNPAGRPDGFEHNGFQVHTVVSPRDCATCHPVEVDQYGKNLMSHAYGNLLRNPVYLDLVKSATGLQVFEGGKTFLREPDQDTLADSCLHCHGTEVRVKKVETRQTDQGEMAFPVLSGWPNQGVGRINPDGSQGACTPCHARHGFNIAMARQPQTCSQCHSGPDVPAFKVFEVSKHGNIYHSMGKSWDLESVPWKAGKDFTAPTCAACHVSLVASADGEVLAERTHQMGDRIPWRIFGLVYAHPHPRSPDTTRIRNKAGLPLPTELTGEPAPGFLIDAKEQAERTSRLQATCLACHSRNWVEGHFTRFENTLRSSNEMTLTATQILLSAYEHGAARGPKQGDSLFNEAIEKKWVEHWLFFANSTRYAAAMSGADYGVFANGRWSMARNIREMAEWLEERLKESRKVEGGTRK